MKNRRFACSALLSMALTLTACVGDQPTGELQSAAVMATASDSQPAENAPESLDLAQITAQLGFDLDDEDGISGASNTAITTLNNTTVQSDWRFGPHLFRLTQSTEREIPLSYNTTSGGPVYAHAWYFRNGWQALGWQFNTSNRTAYTGNLIIPAGSLAVYVGFFSAGGGRVTASLNTQPATGNTAQSSTSTDVSQKFNAAIQQARGQLGAAKGGITQASSINAQKQDFTNGIVILRAGAQEAYAIYGDIYRKWSTDGHTQKYGAPISAITSGRTINGQPSQYQLYDKTGQPSLHAWSKGVFHFNGGIRAEWDRRFNELGHPTSDETNGSQTFEKGRIVWANGRANTYLGSSSNLDNSCFFHAVGKPPGSFAGYYNAQGFQRSYLQNFGWHLGDDLNGVGGGNTDLGDPVYSIGFGQVTEARDFGRGWGNIVFVKHLLNGREYTSMYAHLDKITVKKGDSVTPKQQVGTIGTAHGAYSAHLHLEIREGNSTEAGRAYTQTQVSKGPDQHQIDPTKLITANLCK